MLNIEWTAGQLQQLLRIAAVRCDRIPIRKGWERAERTLNAACSFIAECYAHNPHESPTRLTVDYANPGWSITMKTGEQARRYWHPESKGIYLTNYRQQILREFIRLCEEEHEKLWPTKTPAEELKEKLREEILSAPIERIIDQYEIRRRD